MSFSTVAFGWVTHHDVLGLGFGHPVALNVLVYLSSAGLGALEMPMVPVQEPLLAGDTDIKTIDMMACGKR